MCKCKVVNETHYQPGTPDAVTDILERVRTTGKRIRIFLGAEGKCWNEEWDTIGTVGRSTGGVCKIPLLIRNARSIGGSGISSARIVRIDVRYNKNEIVTLYRNNDTRFDHFISTSIGTVYNETRDVLYARCENGTKGERLAAFMNGKRWCK